MINFKASLLTQVNIQKRDFNNNYKDYKASVFELSPNSDNDYNVLRTISRKWDNGYSFAGDLFDDFATSHFCKYDNIFYPDIRYFAISKTSDKVITSNNILGVTSLIKGIDNTHILKHVQVNPTHKFGSSLREYRYIGKSIIETIKKLPNINEIKLYAPNRGAEFFYENLNFKYLADSIFMHYKR